MVHTLGFVCLAIFDGLRVGDATALGYAIALGAACGLVLDGTTRLLGRWAFFGYAALACAVAYVALDAALSRAAHLLFEGRFAAWLYPLGIVAIGTGLAVLYEVSRRIARFGVGAAVLAVVGVAIAAANPRVLPDDYFASHAFVAWADALLLGAALDRVVRLGTRSVRAVALAALLACVVPPSNGVRLSLFGSPTAIAPWVAARLLWSLPAVAPSTSANAPDVARAISSNADERPIVVLIVVDALRADVVASLARSGRAPALATLTRAGATFSTAHACGTQTSVVLSCLFSGKYFSELKWTLAGEGAMRVDYPVEDSSPRVGALLSRAGVRTVKIGGTRFLRNEYGIAPGFAEERSMPRWRGHASGVDVTRDLVEVLEHADARALFVYAHYMEPHAPYDRGALKVGDPYARYQSEVELLDGHLSAVLASVERLSKTRRVVVVVTADHGEAFGEHATFEHGKTLYEELLRVPLIAYGAGVAPRVIEEPVSVIDLGPTLLELFGQSTPAGFGGQSLAALLRGQDARLSRPIFAEGRLRRAYLDGDFKVIVDPRRKIVEAYDLAVDAGERDNLSDRRDARLPGALATLERFFATHTRRDPPPPYKP